MTKSLVFMITAVVVSWLVAGLYLGSGHTGFGIFWSVLGAVNVFSLWSTTRSTLSIRRSEGRMEYINERIDHMRDIDHHTYRILTAEREMTTSEYMTRRYSGHKNRYWWAVAHRANLLRKGEYVHTSGQEFVRRALKELND